ncbi:MAG: hypothetical protein V1778_00790 [bacterium]
MKKTSRRFSKGFQTIGLIAVIAIVAGACVFAFHDAQKAKATADAVIRGKVVGPTGAAISFTCMPPSGSQPQPQPEQPCGLHVDASAGPDTPQYGGGASPTDGTFLFNVQGGKKYQLNFNGPSDAISAYTFPTITVDIATGETKDVGTITATEKQGRISGIVKDNITMLPIAGVQLNAFPTFRPEDQQEGEQPKPMMPSMATSAPDGTFTIKVDPGKYGVNVMQTPQSSYVAAGGPPLEANCDTTTCNVTGIEVLVIKADATISGRILKGDGTPVYLQGGVGARPVTSGDNKQMYEYNGPINQIVPGDPASGGQYTIKVPSSTPQYTLVVHTNQGGPAGSATPSYSVQGTSTVTVTPNGTTTQNITVVQDTSSIYGKLISDSGFALGSCKAQGTKFAGGGFGQVFAHSEEAGKFAQADIKEDCTYKMVLGEGEYSFGYNLSPSAGFINRPAPPEKITVAANTDVEKNIVVTAGDATITGQVFDSNGKPMSNVWVDAGNEGEAQQNFKTGGQEGTQAPAAGEFRGPGGTKSPQEVMTYCSNPKNATECKNFKMAPGTTGPGGCTNMLACVQYCTKNKAACQEFSKSNHEKPTVFGKGTVLGQGYQIARSASTGRVKINADKVTTPAKGSDYNQNIIHMGTQAGPDGKFTLTVVSGHMYQVRANLPPDKDTGTMIPPKAVAADLRSAKTTSVILSFRTSFGTMTGKVTMPNGSAASQCFVHYWSEGGDDGGSPCSQNGTFTLGYSQGKLHIAADSFSGNTPYGTAEQIITVTDQKKLTTNFQLKERGYNVPSPASKTFDASEQATLMLDNGVEIDIPAGAMGDSGNVTVSASPNINLKTTETNMPVGVGIDLSATDANGQTISSFSTPVTIKLPYDQDYVTKDLGLNESLLKTAYVDDTTGAYEDNSNSTQDTKGDTFVIQTTHFSDYTIVSPGGVNLKSVAVSSNGSKKAKITIDGSKTISLPDAKANWNVGTANFGTVGQYIVVSNKSDKVATKYRSKVLLYGTDAKLKKTLTPFKGYTGGLNQVVSDVTAKSGKAPDGTDDVVVSPAGTGPASTMVYNLKNNKSQKLSTGAGTGATSLNTAELYQAGIENLTTLFGGKTTKAWKMSSGKLVEATGSISGTLTVKNGKVEKKTATPKVSKVTGKCSTTSTSKLTVKGSGFGVTADPIILWNATSALAVQSSSDTQIKITVNPSAVTVKSGVNTMTIVNGDGQAGVKVITCGL